MDSSKISRDDLLSDGVSPKHLSDVMLQIAKNYAAKKHKESLLESLKEVRQAHPDWWAKG